MRRAKLYYLRGRIGKAARVAERRWGIDEELISAPVRRPGEEPEAVDAEGATQTEAAVEEGHDAAPEAEAEESAEEARPRRPPRRPRRRRRRSRGRGGGRASAEAADERRRSRGAGGAEAGETEDDATARAEPTTKPADEADDSDEDPA